MSDGVLEVVGVTDVLHLAFSLGGLPNGVRLCQGRSMVVRTVGGGGVPLQIDGEPCNVAAAGADGLEPFEIAISKAGTALMLAKGEGANGVVSAYAAIEGRLGEQGLSTTQRDELLHTLGRV